MSSEINEHEEELDLKLEYQINWRITTNRQIVKTSIILKETARAQQGVAI